MGRVKEFSLPHDYMWDLYETTPEIERESILRKIKEIDRQLWHYKSPKRMVNLVAKMEEEKLELEEELLKLL